MTTTVQEAETVQAELLALTTALAGLIAVPAQERDGKAIRKGWQRIEEQRRRANALLRKERKRGREMAAAEENLGHKEKRDQKKSMTQLRQRLDMWDRMRDLVARHVAPKPVAIRTERTAATADPLAVMLHTAVYKLANPNPQSQTARDHNCFADIPMPLPQFDRLLIAAYRLLLAQGRTEGARFLDVGSGGGTKVFVASHYFAMCDGLEYDPAYAEAGNRSMQLIAPDSCRVMQGDGLTFEGYGAYDVIYFYRPIDDSEMLARLEQQIFSQARPGTIILAPYDTTLRPRAELVGSRIADPIFIAGVSQAEADALRHKAEYTGLEIVRRSHDFPFDTGFWAPLLDAAQFNG